MMDLRLPSIAVVVAAAVSGCVGGDADLALQGVDDEQYVTVFVQSDVAQDTVVKIHVFDGERLVASKVYTAPGGGLARQPVTSVSADYTTFRLEALVDGASVGTIEGIDGPCGLGEAFVDIIVDDEDTSVGARCV